MSAPTRGSTERTGSGHEGVDRPQLRKIMAKDVRVVLSKVQRKSRLYVHEIHHLRPRLVQDCAETTRLRHRPVSLRELGGQEEAEDGY